MRLIIDESGSYVETSAYRLPNETMPVCLWHLNHADRLDFGYVAFPDKDTYIGGFQLPTLELTANHILRRENADQRREVERLKERIGATYNILRGYDLDISEREGHAGTVVDEARRVMRNVVRLEAENVGLRGDVKQAESHYEAASKRLEQLRSRLDAVGLVLQGKDQAFGLIAHSPVLELARKVVATSEERWVLYEETMTRLVHWVFRPKAADKP